MRSRRAVFLAPFVCAALLSGCITRPVREPVYKEGRVEVLLRSEKRINTVVAKDYDQPVTISAVRMTHILSRLDKRDSGDGNRRTPAIPTEILYSVAEGVSKALARANENQEVVVMATRVERRFKVFDQDYLTSFVAYVRGDDLYIHLSRSDWFVPDRVKGKVPEPRIGDHPSRFRLYGGTGMTLVDTQSVAVSWRDPIFARPTRTKILPTGEVKRKTILLEAPPEELPPEGAPEKTVEYPAGELTPAQLRALAKVEEARAAGEITEAEYRLRIREILDQ